MDIHSVVDFLKGSGIDSSFKNRKKLAASLGISSYSGSAAQNIALLAMMRGACFQNAGLFTTF